jgi:hypothetical protein
LGKASISLVSNMWWRHSSGLKMGPFQRGKTDSPTFAAENAPHIFGHALVGQTMVLESQAKNWDLCGPSYMFEIWQLH